MAFHFEKPEGFTFRSGQYINLILINPTETDAKGNSRNFSLASAPHEPDLMIATRLRDSAFKRVIKSLAEGSMVELEGPYGSFKPPKDPSTPAVFLAGGIGATFVRSIVTQATHEKSPQRQLFFYSTRSPQDAIFMDEFTAMSQQNKNFVFVPTMTGAQAQEWSGEQGQITLGMLQKYIDDLTTPIYYLSGSAAMIVAIRNMLLAAGVNKFNIRSDQFIGY